MLLTVSGCEALVNLCIFTFRATLVSSFTGSNSLTLSVILIPFSDSTPSEDSKTLPADGFDRTCRPAESVPI